MKRFKRSLTLLLSAALLLALCLPALADGDPTFRYTLTVRDAAGADIPKLRALNVGDQVFIQITLTRTDIAGEYDIYGLEFKLKSTGLDYNGDGTGFAEGVGVTKNTFFGEDLTGVTYYDLAQVGRTIPNPLTACTFSYTVTDPAAARLELVTAIIYVTGSGQHTPVGDKRLTLDPNGGSIVGADVSGSYAPGTAVTLPSASRTGYRFLGWSDGTNTFPAGAYTVADDAVLTAQWAALTPTPTPTPKPAYTPPDWLGAALETGKHENYVIGYPDGNIRPMASITRAEAATIFYRLMTETSRSRYRMERSDYPDVPAEAWFCVPVATLSRAGILQGYPDGKFYPDRSITRAELTAIITRFVGVTGGSAPFTDVAGHWAYGNIAQAYKNGWINGYEDGSFRPDNPITRAETFAMVNRMLGRQPESPADLRRDMTVFPDNQNTAEWYYLDVQEAANNHSYQRKADGFHEHWTAKLTDIRW